MTLKSPNFELIIAPWHRKLLAVAAVFTILLIGPSGAARIGLAALVSSSHLWKPVPSLNSHTVSWPVAAGCSSWLLPSPGWFGSPGCAGS